VQNGTRLIVVINGLDDPDDRAQEAKKMLEWGFRISRRGRCSPRTSSRLRQVFGGESRSVKLASREPTR